MYHFFGLSSCATQFFSYKFCCVDQSRCHWLSRPRYDGDCLHFWGAPIHFHSTKLMLRSPAHLNVVGGFYLMLALPYDHRLAMALRLPTQHCVATTPSSAAAVTHPSCLQDVFLQPLMYLSNCHNGVIPLRICHDERALGSVLDRLRRVNHLAYRWSIRSFGIFLGKNLLIIHYYMEHSHTYVALTICPT